MRASTRVVHCRDPHDVMIDRSTVWGNPFSHSPQSVARWRVASREHAIEAYHLWMLLPEQAELRERAREKLRGKVLGCWCKPRRCHGDVLAQIANGPEPLPLMAEEWVRRRIAEIVIG